MVLLAIVGANIRLFCLILVGMEDYQMDVSCKTEYFRMLQGNPLSIPKEENVANVSRKLAYVSVADDAFPLGIDTRMLKPFGQIDLNCIEKQFLISFIKNMPNY